jgi:hypothetical protein
LSLVTFALTFLIYILRPSHMWNFDGIACAAALELGNPTFLFHSNHLLYGAMGFFFWRPLIGVLPRSIAGLQLMTSLLSAVALAGVCTLLKDELLEKRHAVLIALAVAFSAVVWVWSIEAQVYALGFVALAWATRELLRPEHRGKWWKVGLLHAGAILGHIVHVLWVIPAVYWIWSQSDRAIRQKLKIYLGTTTAATIIPYALVIGLIIVPRQWNDRWLVRWLMGSAALNPTSVFQWHLPGWTGPLQWLKTTPRLFWGSFWPYHTDVPLWCVILTGISIVITLLLLVSSWRRRKDVRWRFSLIWLAVYGVFFWTWEPTTECYRMTDLIPWGVLLALGLGSLRKPGMRWGCSIGLVLTLLPINWYTRIDPMHEPERNVVFQETLAVARSTPDQSLYLTTGGIRWIYLLYFTGRSAWDLHSFVRNPEHLRLEIERHRLQQPVFIQTDAANNELSQYWIHRYKLEPMANGLNWVQLK